MIIVVAGYDLLKAASYSTAPIGQSVTGAD